MWFAVHVQAWPHGTPLCFSQCGQSSCELIIRYPSTEWTRRLQMFPLVSQPSSNKHTWTPYSWSVHPQQLLYMYSVHYNYHAVLLFNMDLMFGSMILFCLCQSYKIYVLAAGGWNCHFCEERAEEVSDDSKFRLPRMLRESVWGWGGVALWRQQADEEQQRGLPEDHTALPQENEAGGAGWLSAEQ